MRQILKIAALLLTVTLIGTLGLRWIEGAPWLDCLYMSVITLTTVGFGETVPLSPAGKWFIIGFLVTSLGAFTYSAAQLGQWIVSVRMGSLLERRRMQHTIDRLRDHYIVCGAGRMGSTICDYLLGHRKEFVVVDVDEDRLNNLCGEHNWPHITGDATDDEVLLKAGIRQARSLASVLATDADNVYVVLSARMLNAELQIISRASDEKAVEKLLRAGASRVVSPFSTGAVKMARFMITPSIEDFLEITGSQGADLELADVQISEGSPYVGQRLLETDLRTKGVMVIGIRRANGERLMPPPGDATILAGDSLFAFGNVDAVNSMIGENEPARSSSAERRDVTRP